MLPFALLSPPGLSPCTISVGDVRGCFVFDVDDAWFLVALQDDFLMTRGQNAVCERSFCVAVTHAMATYKFSKNCLRRSVTTNKNGDWRTILTNEHVVGGELRHASRTRLMVWSFLTFGTYAVSAPVSE